MVHSKVHNFYMHFEGMTCHHCFRLPDNKRKKEEDGFQLRLLDDECNSFRAKYKHLKVIIIDEVSMVGSKMLTIINRRLQQISQCRKSFGGISVIIVGDLRQLPPVGDRYAFQPLSSSKLPSLAENTVWKNFRFFELTDVMRQKRDLEFCTALNNMAGGCMIEADIKLIKSREIKPSDGQPPMTSTRLFFSNAECAASNDSVHSSILGKMVVSLAIDQVQGEGGESKKAFILSAAAKLKHGDDDGLPQSVSLKEGATYFVSTNVDVTYGLFNGSTGILRKINQRPAVDGTLIVTRVFLEFQEPTVGELARKRFFESPLGLSLCREHPDILPNPKSVSNVYCKDWKRHQNPSSPFSDPSHCRQCLDNP